ncbi:hypothetical protein V8E53_014217 [Lactarius tabidus]
MPGVCHVLLLLILWYYCPLVLYLPARTHEHTIVPSSYHDKRVSGPSPTPTPSNAHNTCTYSSRTSARSAPHGSSKGPGTGPPESASERERRRSVSQRSIPISALLMPHLLSIGRASSAYHMRDLRRPPRRMETGWRCVFARLKRRGRLSRLGCFMSPLCSSALVDRCCLARVVGGTDTEKAAPLDDPQIEFDARSWRFRCCVMAAISLVTDVPFIVCVAIFA